jgi:hypothetical protein
MNRPQVQPPDLDEKGAPVGGVPQTSSTRLFMQLQVFTGCTETASLIETLDAAELSGVLYEDMNDPRGVGLLTWDEDPAHFVTHLRPILNAPPFAQLVHRPKLTMIGRTYALGHEPDLRDWLIDRPIATATNTEWPWAIFYPLRRSGTFEQLKQDEQRRVLMEHGKIGMSFGAGDFAHDLRLACHGLDQNDNDFLIGLVGKELFPLSAVVQAMRKTSQTSQYLESIGPFFVGRAVWQADD